MRFDQYQISHKLKENLSKKGYKKPTDIQFKAIPSILKGEDVLAIAQTGTGKTVAFALPIIDQLAKAKRAKTKSGVSVLIMVPTRELAMQINDVFLSLTKGTGVKSMAIIGGVMQDEQIDKLKSRTDIVIATPGRMFDLIHQRHLNLSKVNTLVLDEADHMLGLGFYKDIKDVTRLLSKNRQTLYFSATIDDEIKKLAYSLVKNPIRIQLSPKDPVSKNIEHFVFFVEPDNKRFFLERLAKERKEEKIIAFVRTQVRAERVVKAMERVQIDAVALHGGMSQIERNEAMRVFKKGHIKLLICTDVSARGIDIPNVDLVVNYDVPDQPENYVHRIGRTGRGVNKGEAVSFVSKTDLEYLEAIHQYIGKKIEVIDMGKNDFETTLDLSEDNQDNWQNLIEENEKDLKKKRKKTKFKKK